MADSAKINTQGLQNYLLGGQPSDPADADLQRRLTNATVQPGGIRPVNAGPSQAWSAPYDTDYSNLLRSSPISNVVGLGIPALVQKGLGFAGNVASAMTAPTDPMAMVKGRTANVAEQLSSTAQNLAAPAAVATQVATGTPVTGAAPYNPSAFTGVAPLASHGVGVAPVSRPVVPTTMRTVRPGVGGVRRGGVAPAAAAPSEPIPILPDVPDIQMPAVNSTPIPEMSQRATDALDAEAARGLVGIQDTDGTTYYDTTQDTPTVVDSATAARGIRALQASKNQIGTEVGDLGFQPGEDVKLMNGPQTTFFGARRTSNIDPTTGLPTVTETPGTAAQSNETLDDFTSRITEEARQRKINEDKIKAETAAQASIPAFHEGTVAAEMRKADASMAGVGAQYAKVNSDQKIEAARVAAEGRVQSEKTKLEAPAAKEQAANDAVLATQLGLSIDQIRDMRSRGGVYKKQSGFIGFRDPAGFYDASGKLMTPGAAATPRTATGPNGKKMILQNGKWVDA